MNPKPQVSNWAGRPSVKQGKYLYHPIVTWMDLLADRPSLQMEGTVHKAQNQATVWPRVGYRNKVSPTKENLDWLRHELQTGARMCDLQAAANVSKHTLLRIMKEHGIPSN
jgi:hypothetical protein